MIRAASTGLRRGGAWLIRAPKATVSALGRTGKNLSVRLAAWFAAIVRLPARAARKIRAGRPNRRSAPTRQRAAESAFVPPEAPVASAGRRPADRPPQVERRRLLRWRRVAGAGVVVLIAAAAAFGVREYRDFTDDLHASNQHVSDSVKRQLTPGGSVVSNPQVTLISGTAPSGDRTAVSVVLLSTRPKDHRISTLYVPRSAGLTDPQGLTVDTAYQRGGLPLVTQAIGKTLNLPINHVVSLDLRRITSMVDALGGISLRNPTAITIPPQDNVNGGVFPAGRLELDGRRAATFMHSGPLDDAADDRAQALRQGLVLKALVNRLLALPLDRAPEAAHAVLNGAASDLTPSDLLGLIWVRFHASQMTECLVPGGGGELSTASGSPASGFSSGAASSDCRPRHLADSPIPLPATVRSAEMGAVAAVAAIAGLAVLLGAALWYRGRRRRRANALGGVIPSPPAPRPPTTTIPRPPQRPLLDLPAADQMPTPEGVPGSGGINGMSRPELFRLALDRGIPRANLIDLSEHEIRELLADSPADVHD
jgi:LCP family protein required for cell wall assembly